MAEKTFNTRIQLKYDTYENWVSNNPVLKAGEAAIAAIENNAGGIKNAPSIVIKVGDGTSNYNSLKFVSALAADVPSWAKEAEKPRYHVNEIMAFDAAVDSAIEHKTYEYRILKVDDYSYKLQRKLITAMDDSAYTDIIASTITIPKYDDTAIKNRAAALEALVGSDSVASQIAAAIASLITATTSVNGLMSKEDKTKLDGVEAGAQVNTVTGVKGSSENTYRTGEINITKANIGLGNVVNESKATMFTNAALTGKPTAPTAAGSENSTQIATTAFVQTVVGEKLAAADALVFKGTLGTGGTVTALPATHKIGWTYKVVTAGTYVGAKCEIGDMVICLADGNAANNADWTVVQSNLDGAVTSASTTSLSGMVAVFADESGKVIKDSNFTIGTSVPADAKFTDTTYSPATTSADGLMSSADKTKLNGIAAGANKTVVDTELSSTSTNPVQNKAVFAATQLLREDLDAWGSVVNNLAAVASSGKVTDLVQDAGDVIVFNCGNSVI